MRAFHAISCAAIASLGCPGSPRTAESTGAAPAPVMTDLRVGGCAPIRYRELDPDEKPDEPPKPRVQLTVDVPSYLGPSFRADISRELTALRPRLLACLGPGDLGDSKRARVTLTLYMSRSGQVTQIRAQGHRKASCVQGVVQSRVRQITPPRNRTSAYVRLRFTTGATGPDPKPERIVLVEGRDRVKTSLALAAAVARHRGELGRCLRRARLQAPGQLAASLEIDKGAVSSVELNAGDPLESCAAPVLSSVKLADEKIGGRFQCAFSYGLDGAADPAFATTVTARSVAVDGGEPIDGGLVREQRPPTGLLYRQLSERRFAADGGKTTALRLASDAPGALVVRAAEAAAAADVDIGAIELHRGDQWVSIAELSRMDAPRLSATTAQAATPIVLVTTARLWAGAAASELALELETSALDALADHLEVLRGSPGLAHRADVVVGVGPDVSGALLGAVLERIRGAGFDQLELVSAETARARLAL